MSRGRFGFIVEHSVTGRWESHEREQVMLDTAIKDAGIYGVHNVTIGIEREPGSSGKDVANATIRNLSQFPVVDCNPSNEGDKETRAIPFSQQVNVGNVAVIIGPDGGKWLRAKGKARIKDPGFLDELEVFPVSGLKDQADAVSSGYNLLFDSGSEWGTF